MENGELTNVHEKTEEARFYENPNLEEGECEQVSNQSNGDSPSPPLIAMLDNMDIRCENSKEISQQNSFSSQHGSDRGEETDYLQDGFEDNQFKERVDRAFESAMIMEDIFKTLRNTVRFPFNDNSEENNNFPKEEHKIFLVVKVSFFARHEYSYGSLRHNSFSLTFGEKQYLHYRTIILLFCLVEN